MTLVFICLGAFTDVALPHIHTSQTCIKESFTVEWLLVKVAVGNVVTTDFGRVLWRSVSKTLKFCLCALSVFPNLIILVAITTS